MDNLLRETEVAMFLGMSLSFVRKDRMAGGKHLIPFVKIGGAVRYRPADVEAFLAGLTVPAAALNSINGINSINDIPSPRRRGRPRKVAPASNSINSINYIGREGGAS
ncbi:MAG: helix-turn-helix domain-containing protein [Sulfuricella sp.]